MWFKEYLFNLLIQPVHLLLYIVLVSAAIELAKTNMIYALVAIGFILQAEKFVKQMFGIQGEGGALAGGFATGMAFSSVMNKMNQGSSKMTNMLKGDGSSKVRMTDSGDREANKNGSRDLQGFNSGDSGASGGNDVRKTDNKKDPSSKGGTGKGKFGKALGSIKRLKGAKQRVKNKALGRVKKVTNGVASKAKSSKIGTKIGNAGKKISDTKKKALKGFNNSKVGKTFKNVTNSKIGRGAGNLRARYLNKNTLKKAGKLATMGLAAGTFGAMGLAAGLATDDFSNVAKLGAVGVGGGAMLGKQLANQAGATKDNLLETKDTFQQGFHGEDYEDNILNPRLDKQWENDPETKAYYKKEYDKDWKEKMEEAKEFRQQGITDEETIQQGMKLKNKNEGLTTEQAANIMSFKDVSRDELIDDEKREKIQGKVNSLVDDKEKQAQIMDLLDQRFNLAGKK